MSQFNKQEHVTLEHTCAYVRFATGRYRVRGNAKMMWNQTVQMTTAAACLGLKVAGLGQQAASSCSKQCLGWMQK